MTVPRFHVDALSAGVVGLDEAEAHHARASRRLSVGATVALFDGCGNEAMGQVSAVSRTKVEVVAGEVTHRPRPTPSLALAVALPKGPRQDVLIEKCTELGTAEIQPLVTERSVAAPSAHRIEKWRRTAIEAAKQSGQAWLPVLHQPRTIREVLDDRERCDLVLAAMAPRVARAGDRSAGHAASPSLPGFLCVPDLPGALAGVERVLAFVGPEGGWTDAELEALMTAGARSISLGPNVLRIETAAIAISAIVHALTTTKADG
jgi:16S rRNA (uracil1498-N3)-methyltransferase